MADIDATELDRLATDLGAQPKEIGKFIPKALAVSARNVKDTWNGKLYNEGSAKLTGHSVTYELKDFAGFGATVFEAEIGPVRGSGVQAGIDLLLEYGSIHNPPHGAGAAALEATAPDFEKGIDLAVDAALKAHGL